MKKLYEFKKELEDFVVEESLDFRLKGEGDYVYMFIEKKGLNTMDIVSILSKELGIIRKNIGIAGLKDKNAITRQWLSFHKNVVESVGGQEHLLEVLGKYVKIQKIDLHDEFLSVGKNNGNYFEIYLRARKEVDLIVKRHIIKNINTLKYNGMLNFFGMQRFGKGLRNYKRTLGLLKNNSLEKTYQVRFCLQSYVSLWFNEYLYQRIDKYGMDILDGDVLMSTYNSHDVKVAYLQNNNIYVFDYWKEKKKHQDEDFWFADGLRYIEEPVKWMPSGPIWGYNMLLPMKDSQSFDLELKILKQNKYFDDLFDFFREYSMYGIRRPLIAYIRNLEYEFVNDDLKLKFFLPTGAYATVLLGQIFNDVDESTCILNNWNIPRIPNL